MSVENNIPLLFGRIKQDVADDSVKEQLFEEAVRVLRRIKDESLPISEANRLVGELLDRSDAEEFLAVPYSSSTITTTYTPLAIIRAHLEHDAEQKATRLQQQHVQKIEKAQKVQPPERKRKTKAERAKAKQRKLQR